MLKKEKRLARNAVKKQTNKKTKQDHVRHDESAAPGAKQPPFHPYNKKMAGFAGDKKNKQ